MNHAKASIRWKKALVSEVLAGKRASEVAAAGGVDAATLEHWTREFRRHGLRGLGYEFAPGEIPTLEELRAIAQRGFPVELCRGARSAAGFFAARFYGRNDIIHVHGAGVPEVDLIDIDAERMRVMSQVYPAHWNYVTGDAWEAAARYRDAGRVFDMVICDCTAEMAASVLTDRLALFQAITGKVLLVYGNKEMFARLGAADTAASLGSALSARNARPVKVRQLAWRSSTHGGTYWVALDTIAGQ